MNCFANTNDGPWYESMAELAAVYGEMCAINETPRSQQTPQQAQRLNELRAECVAIHGRRIAMNMSRKDAPVERELIGITQVMRESTPEEQERRIANGLAWLDSLKAAQACVNAQAVQKTADRTHLNALQSLYERTGDIKDINTMLVPRKMVVDAQDALDLSLQALENSSEIVFVDTSKAGLRQDAIDSICRFFSAT